MQLTINDLKTGNLINIEIDEHETIECIKALVEIETQTPISKQILQHNNVMLVDNKMLSDYNIKNFDLLVLSIAAPVQNTGNNNVQFLQDFFKNLNNNSLSQNPEDILNSQAKNEADNLRNHFKIYPNELNYLKHQNPELSKALLSENPKMLEDYVKKQLIEKRDKEKQKVERYQRLAANPFDVEAQREIEEEIKTERVNENLNFAQEHFPEAFGSITMLYINVEVNKVPLQAFVDSGAQCTIMSANCAEKCGLLGLLDKRFSGVAVGVGKGRILGRVHAGDMKIGETFFTCSFTILEDSSIDILFGLDNLKRHLCNIDLANNKLTLHNGSISIPFLSEGEIKKSSLHDLELERSISIEDIKAEPNKAASINNEKNPSLQQNVNQNQSGFPEEKIQKLVKLGFERSAAIKALQDAGGNEEIAASILFQSNYGF